MIRLHATRKLFERLPLTAAGQLAPTPRSEWLYQRPALNINPLSGWHGHLITLQRRNCILLVHDETRFPLFLPVLTKPDFAELNDHFVDSFMNTLLKCGADEPAMDAAHRALLPLQIDTQCSRSVQGTLTRMKGEIEHLLYYDNLQVAEITGYRVGAWLADIPAGVKDRGYVHPQKTMLALLARLARTLNATDGDA